MSAPVTVIIAYDLRFYDKLPKLFPHNPAMRDIFANHPQLIEQTAKRNSLQGAYLMLAARTLGLDCGPMSGFDHARVDEEFFAAGACSNMLALLSCTLRLLHVLVGVGLFGDDGHLLEIVRGRRR